jgi:hypothetical protein
MAKDRSAWQILRFSAIAVPHRHIDPSLEQPFFGTSIGFPAGPLIAWPLVRFLDLLGFLTCSLECFFWAFVTGFVSEPLFRHRCY